MQRMMAAQFVRLISAIVGKIAQLPPIDTFLIGTLEFVREVAESCALCAQCHIIFIAPIAAIIYSVTYLIAGNAPVIGTLESSQCIAIEVRTYFGRLVAPIAAVVRSIANVRHGHAQVIVTLES